MMRLRTLGFLQEVKLALLERLRHLVGYVLLEPAYEEVLNLFARVVALIRHGGGLEQVHETGEAFRTSIVGCGGSQDQSVARP